ncbi:MAG: hypothetical protein ACO1QB_07560 [Verrucomicrobiales bacterium]
MATLLNVLTDTTQRSNRDRHIELAADEDQRTFDLTKANPDYEKLVEAIFEADRVHVW